MATTRSREKLKPISARSRIRSVDSSPRDRQRASASSRPALSTASNAATDRNVRVSLIFPAPVQHAAFSGTGYLSILPVTKVSSTPAAPASRKSRLFRRRQHRQAGRRRRLQRVASRSAARLVARQYAHKIPFIVR